MPSFGCRLFGAAFSVPTSSVQSQFGANKFGAYGYDANKIGAEMEPVQKHVCFVHINLSHVRCVLILFFYQPYGVSSMFRS